MRIIFVRHGEPDYAHDCLTERGRIQAKAAADRLKEEGIEEIFSSPLGRAAETAAFTAEALNLPVKTLDFMRELHWGSIDGTPVPADGHPWDLADMLAAEGRDLTDPAWREHPYFSNNLVTAEADCVAQKRTSGCCPSAMSAAAPITAASGRMTSSGRLRSFPTAGLPPRRWGIS